MSTWSLFQTEAPDAEPLTLADAKEHLRVDFTDADDLIISYISAARHDCEMVQGRTYITQTWRLTLDEFPDSDQVILLPNPPVQSVELIQYLDGDGAWQTMSADDYVVDTDYLPPRVFLSSGASWPSALDRKGSVKITYVTGYGDDETDVPELVKQSIRLRVGDYWTTAQTAVVGTISGVNKAVDWTTNLLRDGVTVIDVVSSVD